VSYPLDLDAYMDRIRYTGSRVSSFDTLVAVHTHHVRAIPFENLDVILGRGIRIDLTSIEQKLVRDRRGGYCFEQNRLLAAALRTLGFTVTPLLARVRWQLPADEQTGLIHLLLRVEARDAGPCLADVGFGSMSLYRPLRLEFEHEQPAGLEPRRLVQRDGLIVQQARLGATWEDVYDFTPQPASDIDCEISNWFTSTHPQSWFTQDLMASRASEGCRHTLLNREFTTRYADGRADKSVLDSPEELLSILARYFDLHFPASTRFGNPGAAWPV
jgi:N-hydroxyarylamine O-acetyltransferase